MYSVVVIVVLDDELLDSIDGGWFVSFFDIMWLATLCLPERFIECRA